MVAKRKHLNTGRPRGVRGPRKKRYLVVTNGEVTEPEYFAGLEKELGDVSIEVRHYRRDPSALAIMASDLKTKERRTSSGVHFDDNYRQVFVVNDVDDFTPSQFQKARRTCYEAGMEFIVSNPCFEVWLVDHLTQCPDTFDDAKTVEQKASELGIVGGSRNKHVVYSRIWGKLEDACVNARKHNTSDRSRARHQLNNLHFGPWTDMPSIVDCLRSEETD